MKDNGKGAPNLFYCRPTDDNGAPCHVPDCDGRSACLPQLQRKQKTKDGQELKHQDHFRCTITCRYCGKRRHYKDECHIKRRKSEKLKKTEEEARKNAGKGGKPEAGGRTPGHPSVRVPLVEGEGTQPPPLVEEEAPSPNPKGEQPGDKLNVPSTPSAGCADKGSENAKKRRLNYHSKCLQAAGVEVKFPEER